MRKQEQEARSFFSHGHTEVCNNDIEFVPACREPAVIKGEIWGEVPPKSLCLRLKSQLWLTEKLVLFSVKLDAVLKHTLSK